MSELVVRDKKGKRLQKDKPVVFARHIVIGQEQVNETTIPAGTTGFITYICTRGIGAGLVSVKIQNQEVSITVNGKSLIRL